MQGMLLCFDRDLRIAYILGEIFKVSGEDAAYILTITSTAFRKRLSRARTMLRDFMTKKCGLSNPKNPCHCSKHLARAVQAGLTDSAVLPFAGHPCRVPMDGDIFKHAQSMDSFEQIAKLFRSHPDYEAPGKFVEELKHIIDSGKFELFASDH